MLNASISGSLSVKWQVISVLIQTFAVIYVAAAIMFVLETLGEPTEGLEESAGMCDVSTAHGYGCMA